MTVCPFQTLQYGEPPAPGHPFLCLAMNLIQHSHNVSNHAILPQLDVQYLHPHAAIDSSIGLNPSPLLELSAAIGSKDLCLGAEVGFNTTSASFTKYNAGVAFNKPDFSAALML